MRARLEEPDPHGPRALIEKIAASGEAAHKAQDALNAMSAAPKDATVVNITQAQIDAAYAAVLVGEPHGSKRYAAPSTAST